MDSIYIVISDVPPDHKNQLLVSHLETVFTAEVSLYTKSSFKVTDFMPVPTLIIIDQTKNSHEGYTVLKSLKTVSQFNLVPVLMLNTKGQKPDTVDKFWFDADGYVQWPSEIPDLTEQAQALIKKMNYEKNNKGLREKLCFLVQNELKNLFEVNNYISDLFTHTGLDNDEIVNLRLTLDEIGTNAIRHGNLNDPSKMVIIRCLLYEKYLSVTIEDQGKGFDVTGIPDPTTTGRILLPSGRGIFIARQLMDKVLFHGDGNKVEFIKELPLPLQKSSSSC
ncbi:ATP-binding protein [candidate division CSSED10-310 bacterium]|uniref:ATP-binding protein n=1 Tax=candidate division CSSED10-310 bacterium TaxID=2855610 RepID=A0ABV6Z008_UNCC1